VKLDMALLHLARRCRRRMQSGAASRDLRHTHATLALQAGMHPKVVSERLGHMTVALTLDIYCHAIPAMQQDAAATVADLVTGVVAAE
jgi:integrase